jgi:hypothetical protein
MTTPSTAPACSLPVISPTAAKACSLYPTIFTLYADDEDMRRLALVSVTANDAGLTYAVEQLESTLAHLVEIHNHSGRSGAAWFFAVGHEHYAVGRDERAVRKAAQS